MPGQLEQDYIELLAAMWVPGSNSGLLKQQSMLLPWAISPSLGVGSYIYQDAVSESGVRPGLPDVNVANLPTYA